MPTLANMKRLWVHEVLRVFGDRLVDQYDINWLIKQLHVTVKERMETNLDEMFSDLLSGKKKTVSNLIISNLGPSALIGILY